jgi:hypothetical protein
MRLTARGRVHASENARIPASMAPQTHAGSADEMVLERDHLSHACDGGDQPQWEYSDRPRRCVATVG